MRVPLLLSVFFVLGLSGCAGLLDRPEAPIRRGAGGGPPDDAAGPPTGEETDAGAGVISPGVGQAPDRRVWLLVRSDAWARGLRAHLDPPHRIQGEDAVPARYAEWPLLVHWAGPDSPGSHRLATFQREGRAVGIWYDLRLRARGRERPQADVVADMSWLAARVLKTEGVVREEGRPVLVVATDAEHGALAAAARARLDALGVEVYWVEQIDPMDPVAVPPADGIMPRCAGTDADNRRSWRAAADSAGVRWIPCASPPSNALLDLASAPPERPGIEAFVATLVRSRRAADTGAGLMVVDGLGGWRDDRQIDPVVGDPTAEPEGLTEGRIYHPYEMERLHAVDALLRPAGPRPAALATPPRMIEIRRDGELIVNRLRRADQGVSLELTDSSGAGRYELLLAQRPFILEAGCRLRYGRTPAFSSTSLQPMVDGWERRRPATRSSSPWTSPLGAGRASKRSYWSMTAASASCAPRWRASGSTVTAAPTDPRPAGHRGRPLWWAL